MPLVRRPEFSDTDNGHRTTVSALDAPAHGLAGFIVGFEEVGCRDDVELLAIPGPRVAEGYLLATVQLRGYQSF